MGSISKIDEERKIGVNQKHLNNMNQIGPGKAKIYFFLYFLISST